MNPMRDSPLLATHFDFASVDLYFGLREPVIGKGSCGPLTRFIAAISESIGHIVDGEFGCVTRTHLPGLSG